ncbi:CopG family ribbon-helix-helix protein [Pseudoduganella aquatica]|uniref:CopG family transcriptional regulator n=1 Tax=Pseudoduganella aquatica TaxID=2660641 RepID=A0A7X4H926_9BURK|nr:CopG family transcriptional regulator [Pseudoduganella aquatica]MYN06929.1 CopG family transcriptional regulator [Pseudoduganella aquatica]
MNTRDTTSWTVRIPQPLAERISALASSSQIPVDSIVEQALVLWAEREDRIYQMTLEGLADVDAGRVVDHSVIKAWVEGLNTENPLPLP